MNPCLRLIVLGLVSAALSVHAAALPQVAMPVATPPGHYFNDPITLTLSTATPGARILYTLDGATPDTLAGARTFVYAGPLVITASVTLKAVAVKEGMAASQMATLIYIKTSLPKETTPYATPKGAIFYQDSLSITLAKPSPYGMILYTTDGSTPSDGPVKGTEKLYTGPIIIKASTTIKAVAFNYGYFDSDVMTETYVRAQAPSATKGWYLDADGDGRSGFAFTVREGMLTGNWPVTEAPIGLDCFDLNGGHLGSARPAPDRNGWLLPPSRKSMLLLFRMKDGVRRQYLIRP
jgi:hypothetical protein